jgi:predicted LPLAT superfamily acyltransferase
MTQKPSAHWAALEETGVSWGMKTLLLIYRLLGRTAFRLCLHPVVGYYFLANAPARQASQQYLSKLGAYFPELGLDGRLWHSYRHFIAFGETLLDKLVVWLEGIDPTQVEFHNRQLPADLIAQGQGALLLGGHLGNLQICQALAQWHGMVRLNILVHTKHTEKFNRLLSKVTRAGAIELIQVTELNPAIAIRLNEKIQQGEFLVMVGDRIPVNGRGRTVQAQFLGAPAEFPQGPYWLASILRCPVYTLFSYPQGGRYHIYTEPFAESIRLPRREPEKTQALAAWAQAYAERLEWHCRQAPLQWFNFYAFWDSPRAEEGQPP